MFICNEIVLLWWLRFLWNVSYFCSSLALNDGKVMNNQFHVSCCHSVIDHRQMCLFKVNVNSNFIGATYWNTQKWAGKEKNGASTIRKTYSWSSRFTQLLIYVRLLYFHFFACVLIPIFLLPKHRRKVFTTFNDCKHIWVLM